MENDKTIQKGLARDELLCGTIDKWLIWKFSAALLILQTFQMPV